MIFNINSPGVGEIFRSHHPFFVPKYQRGYAWEEEQVVDFVGDAMKIYTGGAVNHFMGSIVHVHHLCSNSVSRKHEVVDGQQRMTTFSLAMLAVKNTLDKLASTSSNESVKSGCEAKAEEIDEYYLRFKEICAGERKPVPKLTLSKTDDTFFQSLFIDGSVPATRKSHERLKNALSTIESKLIAPILIQSPSDEVKLERLTLLCKSIADQCLVIHIVSKNTKEAFQLFSVLNDRGVNLTDGDLLRAHTLEVLEAHPREQEQVELLWDSILDGDSNDIDKLLKAYYPSVTGIRAPKKNLFDVYIKQFTEAKPKDDIKLFVERLNEEKTVFNLINQGEWPYRNGNATSWDRDRLHRLVNILKHRAAHPLLLSTVPLGEKKFIQVVRLLERFVFRYISIVGAHPSPLYSPYYSEAAKMRRQVKTYAVNSLKSALSSLITDKADDSTFAANLKTKLIYSDNNNRNREIRHFFTTLESYNGWITRPPRNRNKPMPDTMNIYDISSSTIEHIYPQSATDVDADLEAEKNHLGNLTVMASSDNSIIGNDPFCSKKDSFSSSSLSLNRSLAELENWTIVELHERVDDLIEKALKVFAI